MAERGILFSASLVRALLAGTKTVTRRIVKSNATRIVWVKDHAADIDGIYTGWVQDFGRKKIMRAMRCPYGVPGDRLWVRETWSPDHKNVYPMIPVVYRAADGSAPSGSEIREHVSGCKAEGGGVSSAECLKCVGFRWRPSIHMPRWASRITLQIDEVRVERLQEITEEEARAEGVTPLEGINPDQRLAGSDDRFGDSPYRCAFAVLWDELNLERGSWASNPFVWRIGFHRVAASAQGKAASRG